MSTTKKQPFVTADTIYSTIGNDYLGAFSGVKEAWRLPEGGVLSRVEIPRTASTYAALRMCALADCGFHALIMLIEAPQRPTFAASVGKYRCAQLNTHRPK